MNRHFRLFNLHRYLGLIAALLLLLMAGSGWLLSHSGGWRLDQRYVTNEWLLSFYEQRAEPLSGYRVGEQWLVQLGDALYLERTRVADHCQLGGAVLFAGELVSVCGEDGVLLLSTQGQLLEQLLPGAGLPDLPLGVALGEQDSLQIKGRFAQWQVDGEWLQWQRLSVAESIWSEAQRLPEPLQSELQRLDREQSINWERLLIDLHSGRLVGSYALDGVALLLLLMSLTGLGIWFKRWRLKHRQHSKPHVVGQRVNAKRLNAAGG